MNGSGKRAGGRAAAGRAPPTSGAAAFRFRGSEPHGPDLLLQSLEGALVRVRARAPMGEMP